MSLKDLGDHDIRLGIPSVKPFERLLPLSYGTDFQDDASMISKILICLSLGLTIIFPSYLHKQLHFTVILYIELLPGLIQSKPHCKKKKKKMGQMHWVWGYYAEPQTSQSNYFQFERGGTRRQWRILQDDCSSAIVYTLL